MKFLRPGYYPSPCSPAPIERDELTGSRVDAARRSRVERWPAREPFSLQCEWSFRSLFGGAGGMMLGCLLRCNRRRRNRLRVNTRPPPHPSTPRMSSIDDIRPAGVF
ncbi:MAG: hypothetical protein CL933_23285 [Deltaproteobacteria bacterium]|nr:hypothetical protein [Deltaproteobacteria bacterium]